jgi:hypothetical protein
MNKYTIANLPEALSRRSFPSITLWNRLEGRPRTANFDRALKAEVRDALWMLTRQWQLGEFQGDDAGSPVFAKLHVSTSRLTRYQALDHPPTDFADQHPLEATVERRPVALTLDLRLLMGRQWLKLIRNVPSGNDYSGVYQTLYSIALPDPNSRADAPICAHLNTWQQVAAVAGRRLDGGRLYNYLTTPAPSGQPAPQVYDGLTVDAGDQLFLAGQAVKFVAWFQRLYDQPVAANDAWDSARLEYQFACSSPIATGTTPTEQVLVADEYYQGHLDWYNFDIDPQAKSLNPDPAAPTVLKPDTQTLIPNPLSFAGMPNTRWWSFEDQKTNFGDIKPDTTDIAKLMVMEFGLVYANDWFLIPYTLPVGSLAELKGMVVTNVFGERIWIDPAGAGAGNDWQRWSMFSINQKDPAQDAATIGRFKTLSDQQPASKQLLLLPTVPKIQEGSPVESVLLVRDEMANIVWGIEKTISTFSGIRQLGDEAAIELHNKYQRLIDRQFPASPVPIDRANIRYLVMTSVPENWIPFIPVHQANDNRQIQLQRAALPRILAGDPNLPLKVRPRTTLLRPGLDQKQAYYIHEETVPRAGVRVTQSFQRTRWRDGRVVVWLGARKQTGRGEASSGLAFDRVVEGKFP